MALLIAIPFAYRGEIFFYVIWFVILAPASVLIYFTAWEPYEPKNRDAIKGEMSFFNGILQGVIFVLAVSMFSAVYV